MAGGNRSLLPLAPASPPAARPVPLDAAAASALGLQPRGEARAQGLIDTFGRAHGYLRISVTERCNLRCRYCMPEEGVPLLPREELLTFEEIERLARLFVSLGVRKIRLTGGEPLVRRDIGLLVSRLGALKQAAPGVPRLERLAMTSNAMLLGPHLESFRTAGLDALNLSLDTLQPARFKSLTGREGCAETIAAIEGAAATGGFTVKVNAVALAGVNDDELVALVRRFARELPVEVRFIEYMPFEGNGWGEQLRLFPAAAIRARLEEELVLEPLGLDETAVRFAVRDRASGQAFVGRVGIISSMTEPFCGTCNRTRLTADGHFRWCLLDEGELDLRGPLRAGASDEDLAALVEQGLSRKKAGHASAAELTTLQKKAGPAFARSMIRIGG